MAYSWGSGRNDEEVFIPKGRVLGGLAIGIITLGNTWYPLFPGNVANASTFSFPAHYTQGGLHQYPGSR